MSCRRKHRSTSLTTEVRCPVTGQLIPSVERIRERLRGKLVAAPGFPWLRELEAILAKVLHRSCRERGVPETIRRSEIVLEGRQFMKMASRKLETMKGGVKVPVWAVEFEGGPMIEAEIERMLADEKGINRLGIRPVSSQRGYLGSESGARGLGRRWGRVLDAGPTNGSSEVIDLSATIPDRGETETQPSYSSPDLGDGIRENGPDGERGRGLARERSGEG